MATATATGPKKAKQLGREQLRQLSEIERQEYYTSRLPRGWKYPVFNGRQAVLSQRQSGYRTTARAAREIVDNAIEAGAKNVRIILDKPTEQDRQKGEWKSSVRAIAFIDDGPGMTKDMARYALTWGGGTHFDDPNYFGKFGFGLPNSSVNQTTLVQVFTRTNAKNTWHRVQLDINQVDEFGEVNVPEGEDADLPAFVSEYLDRNNIKLGSGTVVVWNRPDRLTYNQATTLKEHLLDDFGVTYRYLLPRYERDAATGRQKMLDAGKAKLTVEEKAVEPIDPLFLTPGARFYMAANPADPEAGGAWETFGQGKTDGRQIPVKYFIDEETGAKRLAWLKNEEELEAARKEALEGKVKAVGFILVRIGRQPVDFVDGTIGAKKAKTVPYQRFEVRQARRGVSFVRSDREVETLDAYPRSAHDRASGLGDWPHVSTNAYHWGVEVRFDPDLDEVFGVGNDKQTVRPIDDFWRVMAAEGIELDKAIKFEEKNLEERRRVKLKKNNDPNVTDPNKTEPAAAAAEAASAALGRKKKVPDHRADETQQLTEKAVKERVELTGESVVKARKAIEEEANRKRYAIEFFDAPGGVFYEPNYGNGMQRLAKINKAHPFYTMFYSKLAVMEEPLARQTVDLLLLTLADGELAADEDLATMYETQRESIWSPFLKVGLKKLEGLEPQQAEERLNDD